MKLRHFSLAALLSIASCNEQLHETPEEPPAPRLITEEQQQTLDDFLQEQLAQEQPTENICLIDLSNNFTPELLTRVKDGQQYFSRQNELAIWQYRLRFGLYHSFPKQMKTEILHYQKAMERQGEAVRPRIEFTGRVRETSKQTLKLIEDLGAKSERTEQEQKNLEKFQDDVETVKNIQQVLAWEGFYTGEITGIYADMASAVVKYKRFHTNNFNYQQEIDHKIFEWTGMKELLNRDFDAYAKRRFMDIFHERVAHMQCLFDGSSRRPMVIKPEHLDSLAESAAAQLGVDSIEGMLAFLEAEHGTERLLLDVPDFYNQGYKKFKIEVQKWEDDRKKTKLIVYTREGDHWEEYMKTPAVVGGKQEMPNKSKKMFHTPTSSEEEPLWIKSFWFLQHWPRDEKWSEMEYEKDEPQTQPGPLNAFGMAGAILHFTNTPQKDPYKGWWDDDQNFRIHLTRAPWSVERGGASHGCVRIHPDMSRIFYFLMEYTPHFENMVYDREEGRMILQQTPGRGTFLPIPSENYIPVVICERECEK